MRRHIKDFVERTAGVLELPGPIYEFGAFQTPGQEGVVDLRPLFPGQEYVGCDMREGPGVDRVLNLHELDLPSASIGAALSLDTLEHVEFPRKAMSELYRVLADGGIVVISSVMNFPIHAYPDDYWRFTPAAFRSLLREFDSAVVESAGEPSFPHTVVGVAAKGRTLPSEELSAVLAEWSRRWLRPLPWPHARSGQQLQQILPGQPAGRAAVA
jgi:SAM-dependent methyltransferase